MFRSHHLATRSTSGFTLIELLIAVAVVSLLSVAGLMGFQSSQSRGRDAQRKSDLERIKIAFEDYYNDNQCYPPLGSLQACRSTELQPYLQSIPCDPMTGEPYLYLPLSNACSGYRVHAQLETLDDPAIAKLNCSGTQGCGYGYNYGIAAGVAVADPNATPLPSPLASPSPVASPSTPSGPIYVYACDTGGTCNRYEDGHPFLVNCPVTFPSNNCNNECSNPVFHCSGG